MSFKNKLTQLDKSWDNTKEEFGDQTGGVENPPSGPYVIYKVKAELGESQSSGKLMVKRNITIKEGDHEGEKCFDNMQLETERGEEFLLKWLNLMGYQVDSLKKDLEDTLAKISENEEATFKVSIKTDDSGLSNVYYNKVIDEGDTEGGKEESGDADDAGELPDLDEMSERKLKKFIKENELDVDTDQDEDDMRDAIEDAWKKKAKKDGGKKTASKKTAEKKDKSGGKKVIKGLKDLCDTYGIKYNKNDGLDELKETLDGYTFKRKELDDEEAEALEGADLEELIK